MKKLLIASTALVATSGFAMADVTLSGSAQFGVIYQENRTLPDTTDPLNDDTPETGATVDDELFLDYELQFDLSGSTTTDSGLTFGATADFENDSDRFGDSDDQGFDPEIFVSGGFGTLTIGDVDVATDSYFGDFTRDPGYDGIGIDNKIDTLIFSDAGAGFDINSAKIDSNIQYEISAGGFDFVFTADAFEENYGIALGYAFGDFRAGIGYVEIEEYTANANGDATVDPVGGGESWSIFFGGETAGFDWDIYYVEHENDLGIGANDGAEATGYGLSGSYDLGGYAILFAANFTELDDLDGGKVDGWDYGLGVSYDLGGGAALQAGIGQIYQINDTDDLTAGTDDALVASLGLTFKF